MKRKHLPAVPTVENAQHNTGIFQKQPVENMIRSFADDLCGVLRKRTRITLRNDEAETNLTILTGEVIVSIHITEGRMKV